MFQRKTPVDLKVFMDAFDGLNAEVVQRRAARNKVFGSFLTARTHLHPLIAAQVIGDPGLPALILAPNPVPEELTLVGVALRLNSFPVLITAANAS